MAKLTIERKKNIDHICGNEFLETYKGLRGWPLEKRLDLVLETLGAEDYAQQKEEIQKINALTPGTYAIVDNDHTLYITIEDDEISEEDTIFEIAKRHLKEYNAAGEKYGTVNYTYALIQKPYIVEELGFPYRANAVDTDGSKYELTWKRRKNWQDFSKNEVCEWEYPSEIRKL